LLHGGDSPARRHCGLPSGLNGGPQVWPVVDLLTSTHMNITRINRFSFTRRWLLGSAAIGILSSHAATVTWNGNGADTNFDTAGNWTPGAPASGDELVFPDSASGLDVALNGTYSPAKLTFSATGFTDYVFAGTGALAGTGVVIEKTGDSFLTLGGVNSFAGQVQVNSGLLKVAPETGGVSFAFGATGNTIKVASGATLDINGQGSAAQPTAQVATHRFHTIEIAGQGIETGENEFAGVITSSGNLASANYGKSGLQHVILTADATVSAPTGVSYDLGQGPFGATATTSGSITSAGGTVRTLTKKGPGTLQIGGTNFSSTSPSRTGVIFNIEEGPVYFNHPNALGDKVKVGASGDVRFWTSGSIATPVEIADGGKVANYFAAITFTGPFTLGGNATFAVGNTQGITMDTALSTSGNITVQRDAGSGNLVFTKDNTVAGSLVLNGAISAQLGSGGTTGSFKNSGGNDTPVDLGSSGTLILNRSDSFIYNAEITGTGTLQKSGSGTVRRTVAANFSRPGNTVASIGAGSLLVNNASGYGISDGTVTVSASATLGGTGSTAGMVLLGTGAVTAARAFLAPGDGSSSTGSFTVGSLQVPTAGSGSLQMEVDGANADKLVVNGDVVLSPAKIAEIAIVPFGSGATHTSYTLLEYTGTMFGAFNSITGVPAGYRVRHDVPNKRVVLEQSAEVTVFPQVMHFDGTTADILANGDGAAAVVAGNWNTTLLNWDQGAVAHLPWINDGSATAILGVGAYTVTVNAPSPLSVAGIKRMGASTASATTITGGTLALQSGAVLHEGYFGTADQGLRISSKLTGTGGFIVSGRAPSGANLSRVTLANPTPDDNTIAGPVAINGGHLRLAASEQLGNSSVITANTVISGATATLETASSTNETIAGLNFGLSGGELKLGGSGVSVLTLDGGGLSIANTATFTYGNSASGIRFANAGDFVKSGDNNVTVTRVNAANFIDLGGTRTIRVNGFGNLSLGVNLVNGALVKQGPGMLALTSDANVYQGNTTVAEGTLRITNPTLYGGGTLEIDSDGLLDLGFASASTVNVVKTFIVAGVSKPAGRYGPAGTTEPGVTGLPEITGSGVIEVDPTWTADPYGPWAAQISNPDLRDKTDDADGDGLDNFTEFAFDGNPSSGAASGKVQTKAFTFAGENALVITIPVRTGAGTFSADANGLVSSGAAGVIYRVQGGANLSAWTLPLTEVTGNPGLTLPAASLSSAAWEYRSFRINGPTAAHAQAFLRASATE
jgi:autotransporter-associated beta strand protein